MQRIPTILLPVLICTPVSAQDMSLNRDEIAGFDQPSYTDLVYAR